MTIRLWTQSSLVLVIVAVFCTVAPGVLRAAHDNAAGITNIVYSSSNTGGQHGADGEDGEDGEDGQDGQLGRNGESVHSSESSATIFVTTDFTGSTVTEIYKTQEGNGEVVVFSEATTVGTSSNDATNNSESNFLQASTSATAERETSRGFLSLVIQLQAILSKYVTLLF